MKFYSILIMIVAILNISFANDSEYYTSGGELIPIISKNVELKKEKMVVEYIGDNTFIVNVKYTLFNHGKAYDSIVGFEAPYVEDEMVGSLYQTEFDHKKLIDLEKEAINHIIPKNMYKKIFYNDENAGIHYFRAIVNGKSVDYSISKVENIKPLHPEDDCERYSILLYHFPIKFKEGNNTIEHRYLLNSGGSVATRYEFDYILEPANRWKGRKIEQFTLFLIMPDYSEFSIKSKSLYGAENWIVPYGIAKDDDNGNINMYLKKGLVAISLHNFTPEGQLQINSTTPYDTNLDPRRQFAFDYNDSNSEYNELPFHIGGKIFAKNYKSLQILKMLPYARRGYIFTEKYILDYYKTHTKWYTPNPLVVKTEKILTPKEREFLKWIEDFKHKILRNLPYAKRGYYFKDENLNLFFANYFMTGDYNNNIGKLPYKERKWIKSIRAKKHISDRDFFRLLNEYLQNYK